MLFRKDAVVLKVMGKGKGGIVIRSLFTGLICNNKRNVIICIIVCNYCCSERQ